MYDGMMNPGRNEECWCGSGKKYKKCHGSPNFNEEAQEKIEEQTKPADEDEGEVEDLDLLDNEPAKTEEKKADDNSEEKTDSFNENGEQEL